AYDEAFYDLLGDCEPDPVERAFARTGCEAPAADLAAALLDAEIGMCEPPPGVHADLDRLAADHRLGVLTNGDPGWQRAKLDAHYGERFDAVVVSCEVGEHKPAVAPFRKVERRLPADQYAMVGDADADIEGAERAGWAAHRYAGEGFGDLPGSLDW
ncbi:MAG: HAD family hydrolase, partial [Halobacteriaceae archaeon]